MAPMIAALALQEGQPWPTEPPPGSFTYAVSCEAVALDLRRRLPAGSPLATANDVEADFWTAQTTRLAFDWAERESVAAATRQGVEEQLAGATPDQALTLMREAVDICRQGRETLR